MAKQIAVTFFSFALFSGFALAEDQVELPNFEQDFLENYSPSNEPSLGEIKEDELPQPLDLNLELPEEGLEDLNSAQDSPKNSELKPIESDNNSKFEQIIEEKRRISAQEQDKNEIEFDIDPEITPKENPAIKDKVKTQKELVEDRLKEIKESRKESVENFLQQNYKAAKKIKPSRYADRNEIENYHLNLQIFSTEDHFKSLINYLRDGNFRQAKNIIVSFPELLEEPFLTKIKNAAIKYRQKDFLNLVVNKTKK